MPLYVMCAILSGTCLLLAFGLSILHYSMTGKGTWVVRTLKVGGIVLGCALVALFLVTVFGQGVGLL